MTSIRTLSAVRSTLVGKALSRHYRKTQAPRSRGNLVLGTTIVGLTCYGVYKYFGYTIKENLLKTDQKVVGPSGPPPASQPSVYSQRKDYALFLWIHLNPAANSKEVAKVAAKLPKFIDIVADPELRDETDELWAGVGFGPNLYAQVGGRTRKSYVYPHRKGALGDMPSSGGDIFIHAKSNQVSKLFELAQLFLRSLPKDSVEKAEDIYSFVYQNGRDLSGFIDGTENRADDDERKEVAVEKETGGSYVITQKWIHNFDVIHNEKTSTLEAIIGREMDTSTELQTKTVTSHVARMTAGPGFQGKKPFEIVRQSRPFGTVTGEAGLFFIGYAADPHNFEYMLDRMVGATCDGLSDDIMRLTRNVKGTYWYFPGEKELANLE